MCTCTTPKYRAFLDYQLAISKMEILQGGVFVLFIVLLILESFCSLQLLDNAPTTFPWVVIVWRDHFALDSMASSIKQFFSSSSLLSNITTNTEKKYMSAVAVLGVDHQKIRVTVMLVVLFFLISIFQFYSFYLFLYFLLYLFILLSTPTYFPDLSNLDYTQFY